MQHADTMQQLRIVQHGLLFVLLCTCITVVTVAHEPQLLWFVTPFAFFEITLWVCFGTHMQHIGTFATPCVTQRVTLLALQSLLLGTLYGVAAHVHTTHTVYVVMYILITMTLTSAWFGTLLTRHHHT